METHALDLAVAAWLDAKTSRSGSARTRAAYAATMTAFRAALARGGEDLAASSASVAAAAATFAAASTRGAAVTPATYNQRLAILSSFYAFAHRRQLLCVPNPIALVERRPIQPYAGARSLDYAEVRRRLAAIDRDTPAGLRDYALLATLLQTGRRAAEVGGLRVEDVAPAGAGADLTFRRCKGGKLLRDRVPGSVATALAAWIAARQIILHEDRYPGGTSRSLWIGLSRAGMGQPLGHGAIAAICLRHLGTSRVHATRHTFARAMEDAGAKVSEIQARLGHASLATTGRYLAALARAENAHASAVADLLGIE